MRIRMARKTGASWVSRPIEEKESFRWLEGYRRICGLQKEVGETSRLVYVADRESDLFELFAEGERQGVAWLIRSNQPRKLLDSGRLWKAAEEAVYLVTRRTRPPNQAPPLGEILVLVARLGGFWRAKAMGLPARKQSG